MILARDIPMTLTTVPVAFNQDLKAVIPGDGVRADYLLYAMLARKAVLARKIGRSAHGTRTLLSHELADFSVPIPTTGEQSRIAAVLSLVQRGIENEGKTIAAMRELRRAAAERLFTVGLGGGGMRDSEAGPVPASWVVERLDACCRVVSSSLSYTDFAATSDADASDGVVVHGIKVSDMNAPGNEIEIKAAKVMKRLSRDEAVRRAVPPGAVVFPKRGAAIATNKKRISTTYTILDPNLIAVEPGDGIHPRFLYHWFQRFDLRTITEPGPTPQLNKKNLVPLLVAHPTSTKEQHDVAESLDRIDRAISVAERRRQALKELFAALLDQLMTGEIRVDKLDIDTSAVEAA